MREHSLRPIGTAVWAACASKLYICVFFLCVASLTSLRAQTLPLSHGERVDYDLYFKWGLIMSKAGLATLSVKESEYQGAPSWHYNLLFRSAGVIEKVFRMRHPWSLWRDRTDNCRSKTRRSQRLATRRWRPLYCLLLQSDRIHRPAQIIWGRRSFLGWERPIRTVGLILRYASSAGSDGRPRFVRVLLS